MNAIRFYTDEDVHRLVAEQLRSAGFDAVSTPAAGRLEESDDSQLEWATNDGRTIVSFNATDLARLHTEWLSQKRSHAGIVLSKQKPASEVVRRLLRLASALSREDMVDRLEFLSSW